MKILLMLLILAFLLCLLCLIHGLLPKKLICFHDWYHGQYSLGIRSKYTGDPIGRGERHCLICDKKQLGRFSYDKKHQQELFGKKKWLTYKTGNKADIKTRTWLTEGVVEEN